MTPALITESSSVHSQENVLRAIAHEIRQPLGAIESIAYYLSMVLPDKDGKHREQLTRIQQLVEQSNWILSNGLGLGDARAAAPETIDLARSRQAGDRGAAGVARSGGGMRFRARSAAGAARPRIRARADREYSWPVPSTGDGDPSSQDSHPRRARAAWNWKSPPVRRATVPSRRCRRAPP